MKTNIRFSSFFSELGQSIRRYPVVLLWSFLLSAWAVWEIRKDLLSDNNYYWIWWFIGLVGLIWAISSSVLARAVQARFRRLAIALHVLPFVVTFILLLVVKKGENPWTFYIFLSAALAGVLLLPVGYWWLLRHNRSFWLWLKTAVTALLMAGISATVLYFGILIAYFSVDYLFGFGSCYHCPMQALFFSYIFVFTLIFLSTLPPQVEEKETIYFPRFLSLFLRYIVIPLWILYTLILYVYGLRIVFTSHWPKGGVAWMIIFYALAVYAIFLAVYPVRDTLSSALLRRFFPWAFYLLFPLIILLLVAIGKRIDAYGFTEKRYLILLLAIWLLFVNLYMLISRQKKVGMPFVGLLVLLLLANLSPWNMYSVSLRSQQRRLEGIISQAVQNDYQLNEKEEGELMSILRYLYNHQAQDRINMALQNKVDESERDTAGQWLAYYGQPNKDHPVSLAKGYRSYYIFPKQKWNTVLNISGYDYMLPKVELVFEDNPKFHFYGPFRFQTLHQDIKVFKNGSLMGVISLSEWINSRIKNQDLDGLMDNEKLIWEAQWDNGHIKMYGKEILLDRNLQTDSIHLRQINAIILWGDKGKEED